ncbi:MAG: hypothetical protein Ct9H300mP11_21150 [Chloroflexota bacterium]|nr:MAG: hypothetical protein Ct9H300mP11_21150 [Chloroflexota bacterium]
MDVYEAIKSRRTVRTTSPIHSRRFTAQNLSMCTVVSKFQQYPEMVLHCHPNRGPWKP